MINDAFWCNVICFFCVNIVAETISKCLCVPAAASSWGQSVGQVWLSGGKQGLASRLVVYTAKMEKAVTSTAGQPHSRCNMSLWQFIVSAMEMFVC